VLDIGWAELAVVGVIVLIVVGPKELPRVLRSAGQWAGKARKIAREFQNSLEDMVRESELDTVKKDIEKATKFDVKKDIENAIDPKGDVKRAFEAPAVDADETGPATTAAASPTPGAKVAPEPPEATPAEATAGAKVAPEPPEATSAKVAPEPPEATSAKVAPEATPAKVAPEPPEATDASPTPGAKVAPEPPEATPAETTAEPEAAATDEDEPAPIKSQANG